MVGPSHNQGLPSAQNHQNLIMLAIVSTCSWEPLLQLKQKPRLLNSLQVPIWSVPFHSTQLLASFQSYPPPIPLAAMLASSLNVDSMLETNFASGISFAWNLISSLTSTCWCTPLVPAAVFLTCYQECLCRCVPSKISLYTLTASF